MKKIKSKLINLASANTYLAVSMLFIKWIVLAGIVGSIVGALSAGFLYLLSEATGYRMDNPWLLYLLPIGGAVVSFFYSKFGKNASQGNNLILDKISDEDKNIPLRMAPLVLFGTVVTHLFGGSAGREGTAVQIGGSIAENIGKLFKLDFKDQRIILMSGISAGFGSVFGTPLAGAVFGIEVIAIGKMEYEALLPCFISSFVGNVVATLLGAKHSHYAISAVPEMTFWVVVKVIAVSILFGLISMVFSEAIHICKKTFTKWFKNPVVKAIFGGCVIIVLTKVLRTTDYLGLGLPMLSDSFTITVPSYAFILKIVFTAITLGAGYQGGEVTPFFFVGATFGNALGFIFNMPPSFFAALGLVAIFAGATNTPIASFFLGLELFHGEAVMFIFMACVISYLFSGHHGIYTSQKIRVPKSRLIAISKNSTLASIKQKKIE